MNIYVYNPSVLNSYSIEDCGLISTDSIEDNIDCGKIISTSETNSDFDFYLISATEDLKAFGSIKLKSTTETKYSKISSEFLKLEKLIKKTILLQGIVITWYGYGTVFEFNNGLERQVIPDVSGGGLL